MIFANNTGPKIYNQYCRLPSLSAKLHTELAPDTLWARRQSVKGRALASDSFAVHVQRRAHLYGLTLGAGASLLLRAADGVAGTGRDRGIAWKAPYGETARDHLLEIVKNFSDCGLAGAAIALPVALGAAAGATVGACLGALFHVSEQVARRLNPSAFDKQAVAGQKWIHGAAADGALAGVAVLFYAAPALIAAMLSLSQLRLATALTRTAAVATAYTLAALVGTLVGIGEFAYDASSVHAKQNLAPDAGATPGKEPSLSFVGA